jgi:hypothetical protein
MHTTHRSPRPSLAAAAAQIQEARRARGSARHNFASSPFYPAQEASRHERSMQGTHAVELRHQQPCGALLRRRRHEPRGLHLVD